MLLLEKRYPKRKLFAYGGAAFISSFVLATSVLASSDLRLEDFMAANTSLESNVGKDTGDNKTKEPAGAPANETQATPEAGQQTGTATNGTAWTAPTYRQQPAQPQPTSPAASDQAQPEPAASQPAATEQPTEEPAPSEPVVGEEPAEDPGVIEEVVDILIPTSP